MRNCLTTFQFQLDNSIPASPGGFRTADFSWFCSPRLKAGGNPQSVQRPTLGPRLGESWPASSQWYEALSPKPQPLPWPTTLGLTTIVHAIALAPEVLALDTCFPAGHLHPVATVPRVALCLSCLPPPPLNFFYRISQLPCRFVLCRFHFSFGLGAEISSEFERMKRLGGADSLLA